MNGYEVAKQSKNPSLQQNFSTDTEVLTSPQLWGPASSWELEFPASNVFLSNALCRGKIHTGRVSFESGQVKTALQVGLLDNHKTGERMMVFWE